MGISCMSLSPYVSEKCKPETPIKISTPNPNPYKFKIIKKWLIRKKSILLVKFEGCTTYDGMKLILMKREWRPKKKLDPHFIGPGHYVLARFEPTMEGLKLAKLCAKAVPRRP